MPRERRRQPTRERHPKPRIAASGAVREIAARGLEALFRERHLEPLLAVSGDAREWDSRIASLATRQHGVVGFEQLIAIGLTRHAIATRVRAGRLHPLYRGVYAVGHRRLSREGRFLAAVLNAGNGAVLSHASAAALWGIRPERHVRIDVIGSAHRRSTGAVRIHRHTLGPTDITTSHGIPVTTPTRTLIDLAGCTDQRDLERAIRQAVYLQLTTTADLADAAEQHAGRRGMKNLRRALINLGEAPGLTRSRLEERFLRFLRKHNLPMPELNVEMQIRNLDIEADCVWHEQKLIVELDGRDGHDSTPAFESDRARDAALTAAGWRVVRVTSRRIRTDAQTLATELRALLDVAGTALHR
jgi:very-short-patch-repair endonuclease